MVAHIQQNVYVAAFLTSDDGTIPLIDSCGIQFLVCRIGDMFQINSGRSRIRLEFRKKRRGMLLRRLRQLNQAGHEVRTHRDHGLARCTYIGH
ncbi:hypothetical protein, partial [uncultured Bifidobacterium sp.]|uniref:hypothetical protein n=1 Tax=uncultured Bifidobacterium sp. TaxID=165187 RepID=UPI002635DEB4